MASNFIEEALKALHSIPGGERFKKTKGVLSPSFGNTVVELTLNEMNLRFVRDRGEVSVDISSDADNEWWPLDYLCEIFGVGAPELNLESNVTILEELLPSLIDCFSRDKYNDTRAQLMGIQERRRNEALDRWR